MSLILSLLNIDPTISFYFDRMNLYHDGDSTPFAFVTVDHGFTRIRVNSGETLKKAANVSLGNYDRR